MKKINWKLVGFVCMAAPLIVLIAPVRLLGRCADDISACLLVIYDSLDTPADEV